MENLIAQLEDIVKCYFKDDCNELYPEEFEVIRDAIPHLKKYAEIKAKVDEYIKKTKKDKPIENLSELEEQLKELRAHQLCLANQVLDIFAEEN